MEPLWLALALLCAASAVCPAAVPPATTDTLVVAREDGASSSSAPTAASEPTTGAPPAPIKLTSMDVTSEVALRYARTAIVTKVRNPAGRSQEATFRVLLPETAFISGFIMTLNGKAYKAYVKEKEEAKQIYNQAVSQGVGAAHIATKARDSNHFTVSVNVEPNTEAVFNLTYEELLTRRNGLYNQAINLHPGVLVPNLKVTVHIKEGQKLTKLRVPRVRTGNEVDATEDDEQNAKAVITKSADEKEATVTFEPDLEEQKRLVAVYYEKAKESKMHTHRPWYAQEETETEPEGALGQFVVQYDVDRPKEGEILVNDGYFVHFFAPPALTPLSKHAVFVLDTSGSMMERKIQQLREAMASILADLNPGDYFSIVEFSSYVKVHDLDEKAPEKPVSGYWYREETPTVLVPPYRATRENVQKAQALVSRLNADGGTNIYQALEVALDLIHKGVGWTAANASAAPDTKVAKRELAEPSPKNESHVLEPIIIFLTDGDPTVGETDPRRIISRLSEKNYGDNKATIFSLAFGEDADRSFLRKLSLRNNGFMRHIYEAADAALQLRDFYRQVASPLLADVRFTYPADQVKESSLTKHKFRTFYLGSEEVVAGRLVDTASELTPQVHAFCGVDDGFTRKRYEIFPKIPVPRAKDAYLPLERLWAYLTIRQLLDERDAAEDQEIPTEAPPADAKPAADKEKKEKPEKRALELALKYEFVTSLTSLVVVKPNATDAVDAESVDKSASSRPQSFATPLVANYGSGLSGFPAAQFSGHQSSAVSAFDLAPSGPSDRFELEEDSMGSAEVDRIFMTCNMLPTLSLRTHIASRPAAYPAPVFHRMGIMQSAHSASGHHKMAFNIPSPYSGADADYDNDDLVYASGPSYHDYGGGGGGSFSSQAGFPGAQGVGQLDPLFGGPPPPSGPWRHGVYDPKFGFVPTLDIALTTPWPRPPVVQTTDMPSPLARYRLQDFPWTADLLDAAAGVLNLPANGTVVTLKVSEQNDLSSAAAAECARATDGAAGLCVYLTRCDAARPLTPALYANVYCTVDGGFAGVCCPKASIVQQS